MPVPEIVRELVQRFAQHRDAYVSGPYPEAQLRREFVDPFFQALGWDVNNEQGYAEAYKDVVHEDALRVGGATKAPDYGFRVGGTRKFFLETKKPAIGIENDPASAFQLRRYAWSAKLPLSILTDFAHLAVYDCRVRPAHTDQASAARILLVPCTEYVARWDEIAGIFSREAVLKGSFDQYAAATKPKAGTAEVDDAFLKEIESWRDALARHLALRDPQLIQRELNVAVQRTIDRIVFLRICEDRGVEPYGRLLALLNGDRVYARLFELFRRADERYNSGLFHFQPEKDRATPPDTLTPGLEVDDKPLKDILHSLYYPESPYEFSVLPADILGQVYEQFLGKIIRLTPGHRAVVEEKPEVKKAGGVYYTPTCIVGYIVAETLGPLLKGRTPKEAAKLRILDPACGSGSFLLGAYQYLLDWHLRYYTEHDPEKHAKGRAPAVYQAAPNPQSEIRNPKSSWRLTTAERKRILLSSLYGVDIDPQAVEVTKLSLLLKVLEGESGEALERQFALFHERALPDLDGNVKCGNSLICPRIYNGGQMALFDDDEKYRINVFDWKTEFASAMQAGGFDAVIGNPPYVRIQVLTDWAPHEAAYYKLRYAAAKQGNYDVYVVFVERGLGLLNRRGRLGMIVPSKFMATDYGAGLRRMLSERAAVEHIVDFGHEQVFANATTYTCLLFLNAAGTSKARYVRAEPKALHAARMRPRSIPAKSLSEAPWVFAAARSQSLLRKLARRSIPLLELPASMCRGSSTGADDVFCLTRRASKLTNRAGDPADVEPGILRRPLYATDFTRFRCCPQSEELVIFPYVPAERGYRLPGEAELRRLYPKACEYLRANRARLHARKQRGAWYGFSAPRSLEAHDHAQILVPLLADRGLCAPLDRGEERFCVMASAGSTLTLDAPPCPLDPYYLLGLLNSRMLFWNLRQISNKFRGGWVTCTKQYFGRLPIQVPDLADKRGKARYDQMVGLVRTVVDLAQRLATAKADHEKTVLTRLLGSAERQIDQLAYEIYELTESEIKVVEEETLGPAAREPRTG